MPEPVHIAAIDAGSNAVRLSIARAYSALDIEPLVNERYSLRLGEGVFVRHRFSEDILKKRQAFRKLVNLSRNTVSPNIAPSPPAPPAKLRIARLLSVASSKPPASLWKS